MRIRGALVATLLCLFAPAAAAAAPVTVNLRVEGAAQTIYEGRVTTDAKVIAQSGSHPCNGTNGGASTTPGPTLTTALDDAAASGAFSWAGTWFAGFSDFGIDRIGPDANNANGNGRYWGYALNYEMVDVGGCQRKVNPGDEVLFAYDPFGRPLLRLTGPASVEAGKPFSVRVEDGRDRSPEPGATVLPGVQTGADGTATVVFAAPGVRALKADRPDAVRSNRLEVCVYVAGSGDCGTPAAPAAPAAPATPGGPAAPSAPAAPASARPPAVVAVSSPRSATYRRGPRLLRGRVEAGDARLLNVYMRLRRIARGGCSWYSSGREEFTRGGTCSRSRFIRLGAREEWSYLLPERLERGRYILDVKAIDARGQVDRLQRRFEVR